LPSRSSKSSRQGESERRKEDANSSQASAEACRIKARGACPQGAGSSPCHAHWNNQEIYRSGGVIPTRNGACRVGEIADNQLRSRSPISGERGPKPLGPLFYCQSRIIMWGHGQGVRAHLGQVNQQSCVLPYSAGLPKDDHRCHSFSSIGTRCCHYRRQAAADDKSSRSQLI
jgi:hypothetical protein